ncbi:unnamed protein product [Anisakis simplex]|uniref:CHK domain-containing protein n=1 Tax=Anisakis simplex TaxID=6269 RepID=A0A0M3K8K7_ANISI|nr:unnamed protein product [Anisakis simplex]
MDKDLGIFGTTVTISFLQRKLRSVFHTRCSFGPNFSIQRIGCKQGFLSVTVRLQFDWQGASSDQLPSSLVLKIPSTEILAKNIRYTTLEELQEQRDRLEVILKVGHASETAFYQLARGDAHLMGVSVPSCYYAQHFRRSGSQSGLLLFDDLCDVAAVKPLYNGLSPRALRAVFEQLANLHAYSLTNWTWHVGADKILRRFYVIRRPSPPLFRKACNDSFLCEPNIKSSDFREYRNDRCLYLGLISFFLLLNFRDLYFHFASFGNGVSGPPRTRIPFRLSFQNGQLVHKELKMMSVLTHGDLWTNNILWRKVPDCCDGETFDEIVAIIDWQNAHAGNVAEDFVRLLGSSVDPDVRRGQLDHLLLFYHQCLLAKLRERNIHQIPFTVEQIKHAYERLFGQGLLIMLPSLSGHADEGNGLLGEEHVHERQQRILYRCRCLIEDFLIYKHKLQEEQNASTV